MDTKSTCYSFKEGWRFVHETVRLQNFCLLFVLQIKVDVVALALVVKLDRTKDPLLVCEAVPAA